MRGLFRRISLLALLALSLTPFYSFASAFADSPAAPAVVSNESLGEIVPGQILVKYKSSYRVRAADGFQAQSLTPLIQKLTFSESVNISEKLEELRRDPNVEIAEPVYKVHLIGSVDSGTVSQSVYTSPDLNYMHNWGKTVTQLTYAAEYTPLSKLQQVVVAVLDTGVYASHPDFANVLLPGKNFISPALPPEDDNGHGTNVAGIIAAKASSPSGYSGAAPGTKIMPLKILNSKGEGNTADVVAGIQYAVANGARILNMSIGSPEGSALVHDAIKDAVAANVLVIAAAGNEGNNWVNGDPGQLDNSPSDTIRFAAVTNYPAIYDEVVSVGALEQLSDMSLTVADFSNSMKVDVAAPGVNIYSTALPSSKNNNSLYGYMSGTSQATPLVSALAALIIANDPSIKVANVRAVIENNAKQIANSAITLAYVNVKYGLTFGQLVGNGRIDGKDPIVKKRVEFNLDTSKAVSQQTVTISVYTKDISGVLVPGTWRYAIYDNQIYEDYTYGGPSDPWGIGGKQFQVIDGFGSKTINLTASIPDVFGYKFIVQESEGDSTIISNPVVWIQRPAVPQPDKAPGTYTGNVSIQLSSATPGTTIEYVQLNKYNDETELIFVYPIFLSTTTRLLTVAKKNHIYSSTGVYDYTVNPAPVVSGGGGGSFGGVFAPPFVDKKDGVLRPKPDEIIRDIDTVIGEVPIPVKAEVDKAAKQWTVELPGYVFRRAAEKKKPLNIQAGGIQIQFPAGSFIIKNATDDVQLKTSLFADSTEAGTGNLTKTRLASTIFDFSLTDEGNKITTFEKPVQVTLNYDPTKVSNPDKLAVYYYDEAAKAWTIVGGTVNKDHTITVDLNHFSKYAVMEPAVTKKVFSDLKGHWAQKEIEEMAARGIVDGISEDMFGTEQNVTRAEFVTLISRALGLPAGEASTDAFTDVARTEWYSPYVYAASKAKLVSGVDTGKFAPNEAITREQLAVLMVNAYLYTKHMTLADLVITQEVKFTDEGSVSSWARIAVRTANALGLMSPDEQGRFNPLDNTSRAQAAVVLYRLLTNTKS